MRFDICRQLSRAQRVTEEERNHQTQLVQLEAPLPSAFSPPSVCQWPWPSPNSTMSEPIPDMDRHFKVLALVEQKERDEKGKHIEHPAFFLSLFSFGLKRKSRDISVMQLENSTSFLQ